MRQSEKGIALLSVLWTLILLSVITAVLITETHSDISIARNFADSAIARASADAGVQRGILDLLDTRGGRDLGTAKFSPNGSEHVWYFGNSAVLISVRDERGKLNLNQASEVDLSAVLKAVGVNKNQADMLADAIVDFRDPDKIRHVQGAEEADYLAAGLATGPKDAPFETLEELQRVLGMTVGIYDRVSPYLTLYSVGNTVNPERADEKLTASLRRIGFRYFVTSPGAAYSIRAVANETSGAVFVREAVVQVLPESENPVRILAWRQAR